MGHNFNRQEKMIVTIDGPAGSGKSSTAKEAARRTGWHYLDSGSLYRTCAFLFNRYGKDLNLLLKKLSTHEIRLDVDGSDVNTMLDGENVGDTIRTQEVSDSVSLVATVGEVRDHVNRIMRQTVRQANFIADGRDLGSVVFPDAEAKFYLKADLEERARRRYNELKDKGIRSSIESILGNLEKRDKIDSERDIAPLRIPDDAFVLDTTDLDFDEQVEIIAGKIREIEAGKNINNLQ